MTERTANGVEHGSQVRPDGRCVRVRSAPAIALTKMLVIALQWTALVMINWLGYSAASALHLPLPGNLIGMLLLLALLSTGAVPARWFKPGAPLLTRHLAFFFVPITVGLMRFGGLFARSGAAILVTLVVSAAVGIFASGFTSQALGRQGGRAEVTT